MYLFIISFLLLFHPDSENNKTGKEKLPDLVIKELSFDKWDTVTTANDSYAKVVIRNNGTLASAPCKVKIYDLDMTSEQAKKSDLSKEEQDYFYDEEDDVNYEVIENVPALKPGEEVTLILVIKGHWIFDPNIEMEGVVDFENKIKESKENNNLKRYFLQG